VTAAPLVCERCGVPHPAHPDAAKAGGVPLGMDGPDRLCVVCRHLLGTGDGIAPAWTPPALDPGLDGSQTTVEDWRAD
jgi:hypothetical protein